MRLRRPATAGARQAKTDVAFTVAKTDLLRTKAIVEKAAGQVGALGVRYEEDIVKVSIVGLGMRSHAGVAAKMFRILANEGINVQAISTSEIKVSVLMSTKYAELAVRALHDGFGLGNPPATTG
jgi:aspartate kinase